LPLGFTGKGSRRKDFWRFLKTSTVYKHKNVKAAFICSSSQQLGWKAKEKGIEATKESHYWLLNKCQSKKEREEASGEGLGLPGN
jgi:hypothetical protein